MTRLIALLLLTWNVTPDLRAQAARTSELIQAQVPAGTAPVASPSQPYVYRKVNDKLYVIAEIHQPFPRNEVTNPPHTQQMGLVIGSKKAALIDTGLGLADLRAFVSQFTSLPVIVLNTHGHVDHVGANQLFDMSYITKEDEPAMLRANRAERLKGYTQFMEGNAEMIAFAGKSMIPDRPFKYEFIKDGDRIDLGGVELEVVAFPGHSPGSVAFIDRRDNVAFCGDSILFRVLLGDREKLAQWLTSLENFADKTQGIDTIINGHQWEPFHRSDIDEERALAHAILNRTIQGTRMNILFADRMIYILGNKRIGLSTDELPQAPQQPPDAAVAAAIAGLEQNQAIQGLQRALRTLQGSLKVPDEVKKQVDALTVLATTTQNKGNTGDARRILQQAIALQRGMAWDPKAEFTGSLVLRTNSLVADSLRTFYAQLTQHYGASYTPASGLRLRVALAEFQSGKEVRELGTHPVTSRDLIDSPFVFSANLEGVPDGAYKLTAELSDGNAPQRHLSANVQLVRDLEGQRGAVEQRLAKVKGGESTKATIRYPFDYARVINLGQRDLIAPPNPESAVLNEYVDFSAQIRNSLALLTSLESGQEPLVRAKGEHERHYAFAEAGEIMPYTVYVPARYDGKAKLPLVVLLHGGGADNNTYFKRRGPASTQAAEAHGFIVVAPMGYRPTGGWGAMSPPFGPANLLAVPDPARARTNELSEKDALNVVELVASEYGVDRSRMYLMGNSMGGFGTWYLGGKYATRWAAIAPAAGTPVGEGYPIERFKGLPIMYTNGEKDMTVPVEGARTMMAFLKDKGFDIPYNEIKDGTHDMAVWQALPVIFDFFEQHKR